VKVALELDADRIVANGHTEAELVARALDTAARAWSRYPHAATDGVGVNGTRAAVRALDELRDRIENYGRAAALFDEEVESCADE
jgi:hypothetical protein